MAESKLTKGALRLLKEAASGSATAGPRGAAVIELRKAGYVEWAGEAGANTWWLDITEAGRAALQLQGGSER